MTENQQSGSVCLQRAAWAAIFLAALVLRGYRITGWILNYDETHWLLYAERPELLWTTAASSYARPDILLAWLGAASVRLIGPNELALRFWPVIFGALTVFPLGRFVSLWTGNKAAGLWAAALFAVSPLPVYLGAQALPDTVAIFFIFGSLVGFAHLVREPPRPVQFATFCLGLALATLAKATALYVWVFLALIGPVFLRDRRSRFWWFGSLVAALVPMAVVVALIKWQGSPLTFFEQPTVRSNFRFELGRIAGQLNLFGRFFGVALLPLAAGLWIAWKRNRKWLVWFGLLALMAVTPFFRVYARELLYLLPAIGLFSGLAVELFPKRRVQMIVLGGFLAASLGLCIVGIPIPPQGPSLSDRTTALIDRPQGWPSREAARWLQAHVGPDEAALTIGLGFTDPAILQLRRAGITMYGARSNWDRLRDPANRIKYVVFVDDYSLYAPDLARYAATHLAVAGGPHFPGYTIYDCQKDGRFVAYPDAFNSVDVYLQRGVAFLQEKQCERAIESLQTAVRVDPDSVAARHNLMIAFQQCGRGEDAVPVGAEILQKAPADPLINADLAVLDLELGRIQDGLAQCRKNIRLNIAPGLSYGVLGQLLERQGDLPSAREAYEKSLSIDPQNPVTLQLLANLRIRLARPSSSP